MNYVGSVLSQKKQTEARLDLLAIQRAIESFQQQEERSPVSLQELVDKGYLKSLPQPPQGQKFEYDPVKATLRLVPSS